MIGSSLGGGGNKVAQVEIGVQMGWGWFRWGGGGKGQTLGAGLKGQILGGGEKLTESFCKLKKFNFRSQLSRTIDLQNFLI